MVTPICKIEGCGTPVKYAKSMLCSKHGARLMRYGDPNTTLGRKKHAGSRRTRPDGYVMVKDPTHPLGRNGWVSEHRKVLAETTAPPVACHWCGVVMQTWKEITVDHLNNEPSDNSPENLVPSCNACNRLRGAAVCIFDRIIPERLDELLKTLREYKEKVANAQ